ncbi:MAG: hypothetical protein GY839_13235, partial [candidate division Zixibacteria bacterium]|nr:hypothetical protein [candidate division Zixibacteria bacterium]
MSKVLRFTLALIFICFASVSATIINVPADQTSIQQGIDASLNGDTVLVQPGTYFENINFNGHSIVLGSLFLTTDDTSYISTTVIDANFSGRVVVFENDEDSTTVIVGFTIQNGYYPGHGGGILCDSTSPAIIHNKIMSNETYTYEGHGAGIYCSYSNSLISDNLISENVALDGTGGGIICVQSNILIISNSFISNIAERSGAIDYCGDGVDIIDNTISNNVSTRGPGGIGNGCGGGGGIISGNYISGNAGGDLFGPGGILCSQDTIRNNIIIGNSSLSEGGAIMAMDGALIEFNIIVGNTAVNGAGIHAADPCIIKNNTITGNIAENVGGAIACMYFVSDPVIKNTICWDNSPNEIYTHESAEPVFTYCNIQGGYEGEGNIDCLPMFCDSKNGNYHIADVSCCVG